MPEVYTCLCGDQEFHIFSDCVKCFGCGKEYKFPDSGFEIPVDFNMRIRTEERMRIYQKKKGIPK